MIHHDYDIIVVGSGIAGLTFALGVAEGLPQARIAVLTKKERRESNTNYAQGGIAAVMSTVDSFLSHTADTLKAGAGLCHEEVVAEVVRRGPDAVRRLAERGAHFTHDDDKNLGANNNYDLVMEGGHSSRRVVHAADLTGQEIERALIGSLLDRHGIDILENHLVADALFDDESGGTRIAGALVFNAHSGQFETFSCKILMLATGGIGQVYRLTTNPLIATGDGIAIAFRAGARVANMEFVQFHPTAFYEDTPRSLLISEAVRGEGARLLNMAGEAFMKNYDERGDLAPRDIVARAIDTELKKSNDKHVWLDLSAIPTEKIRTRFPNILAACQERGVDITCQPIPVAPSAHYLCGGVIADLTGRTNIAGLLVAGEVAHTGMHGANRLASNSLLEAVVMGEKAAESVVKDFARIPRVRIAALPSYASATNRVPSGNTLASQRARLKSVMTERLGIVRSLARIAQAQEEVAAVREIAIGAVARDTDIYAALELRNMAEVAEMIIALASARHESRGLHYLSDFPHGDDRNWKKDSELAPAKVEAYISPWNSYTAHL